LNSDILKKKKIRRKRNWKIGWRMKSICAFARETIIGRHVMKRKEMRSGKDHYNGFVTMCGGVGLDNYHI